MWKKRLCLALIMICAGTAFASIRKVQGQFQFDGANRLTNTITPLNHSTSLVFNHQGLVASIKDAANQTTSLGYDGKGRLTNRTDNVASTFYKYDANDNMTNISETINSQLLTLNYSFDAYNRVSSYKDTYGNLIQYKYDSNGNLTNLIYPGGKNVYYAYDSLNRMTNVMDWAGRKTSLNYDLDGRVTSLTRPNGTYRTISYDAAGEATNILEQNSLGFPIALFRHNWNVNATMQWEFAAPLPHTNAPPARTMTYDDDNELATVNGQSVSSDANGNLTSGPLTNYTFSTYIYDARNRLLNAGGITNIYDAVNNRIGQTYGTNFVSFVVNPNAKLPQVLERIKNGVTTYYIYGAGLLYEVTETATMTNALYYHYDYRGSTVALTDDNGNVTDRVEYSAYGTLTYRTGNSDTPFLFNGRYGVQTDNNGLLYMRSRYYSPFLCRFINPDPSGFKGGLNFYAYANGNPVSLLDPFGLGAIGENNTTSWIGYQDPGFNIPAGYQQMINNYQAENDDTLGNFLDLIGNAYEYHEQDMANTAITIGGQQVELMPGPASIIGDLETLAAEETPSLDALSQAAGAADRGGLTAAGRSLTKHGAGARPGNTLFPAAQGNPATINQAAQNVVDDILTTPGSTLQNSTRGRFGPTIEITAPDGRGMVYDANGKFLFFKE